MTTESAFDVPEENNNATYYEVNTESVDGNKDLSFSILIYHNHILFTKRSICKIQISKLSCSQIQIQFQN